MRNGRVPSNGNGFAVSNGNGSAAYPSRADVASGAKAANGGELAQLLSRLDESGPRWMLGAIAHGVISGQGAAARDLRARSGRDLSQGELDHWSHRVTVVCQEIKVDRPFQVVDVSTFGTVYQMEPDVAQEIRRRLQNGHATASSHRAGTSHQPR